jgi:hypothetical protein
MQNDEQMSETDTLITLNLFDERALGPKASLFSLAGLKAG